MRGQCKLIDNLDYCYLCGKPAHGVHHLLFGQQRECADQDGIYIPICDECHMLGHLDDRRGLGHAISSRIHDNIVAEDLSKMLGEAVWIAWDIANQDKDVVYESICKFRKRYGRSYL